MKGPDAWRPWFVWYPKWVHFERPVAGLGRLKWLCWVERRLNSRRTADDKIVLYWEYRPA